MYCIEKPELLYCPAESDPDNQISCNTTSTDACPYSSAPSDRNTNVCLRDSNGHWNCPTSSVSPFSYPVPVSNLSTCVCNGVGVCDSTSFSSCACNIEYTGSQCNSCAVGYTGYPNCVPAAVETYYCNITGTNVCSTAQSSLDSGLQLNSDGSVINTTLFTGPFTSLTQCETQNPYAGCRPTPNENNHNSNDTPCNSSIRQSCCANGPDGCPPGMYYTGQYDFNLFVDTYQCTPYASQACKFCGTNTVYVPGCICGY